MQQRPKLGAFKRPGTSSGGASSSAAPLPRPVGGAFKKVGLGAPSRLPPAAAGASSSKAKAKAAAKPKKRKAGSDSEESFSDEESEAEEEEEEEEEEESEEEGDDVEDEEEGESAASRWRSKRHQRRRRRQKPKHARVSRQQPALEEGVYLSDEISAHSVRINWRTHGTARLTGAVTTDRDHPHDEHTMPHWCHSHDATKRYKRTRHRRPRQTYTRPKQDRRKTGCPDRVRLRTLKRRKVYRER